MAPGETRGMTVNGSALPVSLTPVRMLRVCCDAFPRILAAQGAAGAAHGVCAGQRSRNVGPDAAAGVQ